MNHQAPPPPPPPNDHDPLAAAMAEQHRRRQAELESKLAAHVSSYRIDFSFPAHVFSGGDGGTSDAAAAAGDDATDRRESSPAPPPPLRTSSDFVNHRLVESGLLFDADLQSLGEATEAIGRFVDDMRGTGCYDGVQVVIGRPGGGDGDGDHDGAGAGDGVGADNRQPLPSSSSSSPQPQSPPPPPPPPTNLDVILTERRWYKLYVGGGIKHDGIVGGSSSSSGSPSETLPRVQLETTGSLLNLTGTTDVTTVGYTVDQTGGTTLNLSHDRPLYGVFAPNSTAARTVLTHPLLSGSKTSLRYTGRMDAVDWESVRSSRDRVRSVGVRVANVGNVAVPESAPSGPFACLEWTASWRDTAVRRHPTIPFGCDASPEIVAQVGPSWKNSLTYRHMLNNSLCDDRYNPTRGVDAHWSWEVAGPPGDVGFVRGTGGAAVHVPVTPEQTALGGISVHGSVNGGFIRPLTYGGLCPATTSVTDRFYVGGPLQLRGFMPSGIGPRAETGGSSTAGGDALGGDLYYTATVAASIPFPAVSLLRDNGVRVFAFANAGTLTALPSITSGGSGGGGEVGAAALSVLRSTRAAVGGGLAVGTPMGRLEATYAVPLRYGPRDARRSVQFGLGFSFG